LLIIGTIGYSATEQAGDAFDVVAPQALPGRRIALGNREGAARAARTDCGLGHICKDAILRSRIGRD
jgi:hypothetical protein